MLFPEIQTHGRKLLTFWRNLLHPFLWQKNQPYTIEETEEFKNYIMRSLMICGFHLTLLV